MRVLITGATGGIGMALAEIFHQQGAHICLSARREDLLKEMSKGFKDRCSLWPADLSLREQVQALIPAIEKKEGPVSVLINNGGMTQDQLSLRMTNEAWDTVLSVNLTAAFLLSRDAAKSMMKAKTGRIINISSVVAFMGNPGQANYAAAKAGLIGLTRTMALEVSRWGITVNAIAPGYIKTPMTDKISEDISSKMLERIPLQRMGTPAEVAYWASCLAQPHASYMTGQVIRVDGGLDH